MKADNQKETNQRQPHGPPMTLGNMREREPDRQAVALNGAFCLPTVLIAYRMPFDSSPITAAALVSAFLVRLAYASTTLQHHVRGALLRREPAPPRRAGRCRDLRASRETAV